MARRTKLQIQQARARALANRKARLKKIHRMTLEQYESLKAFQGGTCPLCKRAKGISKALAVEHDHKVAREQCDHPENESCIECWRGLACGKCNGILGFFRDDPEMALRFYSYLIDPPAQLWREQFESVP
jgi:hypothetical protein